MTRSRLRELTPGEHQASATALARRVLDRRIIARGIEHAADPFHQRKGQTNTENRGRGVYVLDPDGHNLEMRTRSHDIPRVNG